MYHEVGRGWMLAPGMGGKGDDSRHTKEKGGMRRLVCSSVEVSLQNVVLGKKDRIEPRVKGHIREECVCVWKV